MRYNVTNRKKGNRKAPAFATILLIAALSSIALSRCGLPTETEKRQFLAASKGITAEDIINNDQQYKEESYSVSTLENLREDIKEDYENITILVADNIKKQNNIDKRYDANKSDRLYNITAKYSDFIIKYNVDFNDLSANSRIIKAVDLYKVRIDELEDKIAELGIREQYLSKNSGEYLKNEQEIKNCEKEKKSILDMSNIAIDVMTNGIADTGKSR